jgi:hypothetical protein
MVVANVVEVSTLQHQRSDRDRSRLILEAAAAWCHKPTDCIRADENSSVPFHVVSSIFYRDPFDHSCHQRVELLVGNIRREGRISVRQLTGTLFATDKSPRRVHLREGNR